MAAGLRVGVTPLLLDAGAFVTTGAGVWTLVVPTLGVGVRVGASVCKGECIGDAVTLGDGEEILDTGLLERPQAPSSTRPRISAARAGPRVSFTRPINSQTSPRGG